MDTGDANTAGWETLGAVAPDALPALHGPGRWVTEGWAGAMLTASEVVAAGSDEQAVTAERFLQQAIDGLYAMLTTR